MISQHEGRSPTLPFLGHCRYVRNFALEPLAMRRFTLGAATERKIVVIELSGTRVSVVRMKTDGSTNRTEKELKSEAEAKAVSDQMARELISRGYVEQVARGPKPPKPQGTSSKPAPRAHESEEVGLYALAEEAVAPAPVAPLIPRLAHPPGAEPAAPSATKKKKGAKKKRKNQAGDDYALDKRVLAGISAVGAVLLAALGYIVYDHFLKPPTIVGTWRGSMLEYEIGGPMSYTKYDLLLDEKKRASLTLQEKITSVGTYALRGNRLTLSLKNEDDLSSDVEYKIALGRVTLDLMDPETGKLLVELIRFREPPVIGKKAERPAAPANLADELEQVDKAQDESLASVEFSPKDGAFKVRHPEGWEADTGSRPDNTYSWVSFTHDLAKIEIRADIKGSLMSGSDSVGQHEEGSEAAPVHIAHEEYTRTISQELTEYNESKPAVFKGSQLGEGRISVFTVSEGGLVSSTRLRGYHVTLLTKDRRVSILCKCPEKEFPKLKPTFLAVCRSLSR
jgi:hypothetical protein